MTMTMHENELSLAPIYELLQQLGAVATYSGYFYAAYAVWLGYHQPQRMVQITKDLYPAVAQHFNTTWQSVERSLRTLIAVLWRDDAKAMRRLAGHPLSRRPSPGQFIAILVARYAQRQASR